MMSDGEWDVELGSMDEVHDFGMEAREVLNEEDFKTLRESQRIAALEGEINSFSPANDVDELTDELMEIGSVLNKAMIASLDMYRAYYDARNSVLNSDTVDEYDVIKRDIFGSVLEFFIGHKLPEMIVKLHKEDRYFNENLGRTPVSYMKKSQPERVKEFVSLCDKFGAGSEVVQILKND